MNLQKEQERATLASPAPEKIPPEIYIKQQVIFEVFDNEGHKIENAIVKRRASWLIVQEGEILGKAKTKKAAILAAENEYFDVNDGGLL